MKAEDVYPNLAVWIRGQFGVWPGIVTRVKRYTSSSRGYLSSIPPSTIINGFMVIDDIGVDQDQLRVEEVFCLAEELEPRDPNNLDEVPPEPLGSHPLTIMDESGIPTGEFETW